ncbi:MAG: hypothetical protein RIT81_03475 [Deltaproteobacteria bacterium]
MKITALLGLPLLVACATVPPAPPPDPAATERALRDAITHFERGTFPGLIKDAKAETTRRLAARGDDVELPEAILTAFQVMADAAKSRRTVIVERGVDHLRALGVEHVRDGEELHILPSTNTPLGRLAYELRTRHDFALVYSPTALRHRVAVCRDGAMLIDHHSVLTGTPSPRVVRHEMVHVRQFTRGGRTAGGKYIGVLKGSGRLFTPHASEELEAYANDLGAEANEVAKRAYGYSKVPLRWLPKGAPVDAMNDEQNWLAVQRYARRLEHSAKLTLLIHHSAYEALENEPDLVVTSTNTLSGDGLMMVVSKDDLLAGWITVDGGSELSTDAERRRYLKVSMARGVLNAGAHLMLAEATDTWVKRTMQTKTQKDRQHHLCALRALDGLRPDVTVREIQVVKTADLLKRLEAERVECAKTKRLPTRS